MNTLTLLPELNNDKEARRAQYDGRKQDHGTAAGEYGIYYNGNRQDAYERGYDERGSKKLAQTVLKETHFEAIDAQLDRMTPHQLENTADTILKAAGFEEPGDLDSFRDSDGHVNFQTAINQVPAMELWENEPDLEFYVDADTAADEFSGIFATRKAQARNADRMYQGHINPDDDLSDFVDGFHITDRL